MTPEGKIKAKLNARLRTLKVTWRFMPVTSGYGMQALDYLLCVNGHFVAIETKARGKKPTPRQRLTIDAINQAGGMVFVISTDEEIDSCIQTLEYLNDQHASDHHLYTDSDH